MQTLKRDAPIPLYYQLKRFILSKIETKEWPPGYKVPSEEQLASDFGISRMTARQALTELVNEGLLYRQQGRGTFVAGPKITQHLAKITSFTEDMVSQGKKPEARLLEKCIARADDEVAAKLNLEPETQVMLIDRLRLADGEPLALETAYVVPFFCPSLLSDDLRGSLNSIIQNKYGHRFAYALQTLEASIASDEEAELLGVPKRAPVLRMERVYFLQDGRPIMYVASVYRGDKYRFTVTLEGNSHSS